MLVCFCCGRDNSLRVIWLQVLEQDLVVKDNGGGINVAPISIDGGKVLGLVAQGMLGVVHVADFVWF